MPLVSARLRCWASVVAAVALAGFIAVSPLAGQKPAAAPPLPGAAAAAARPAPGSLQAGIQACEGSAMQDLPTGVYGGEYGWEFTGTTVPGGPLATVSGQTVQVRVVISFS